MDDTDSLGTLADEVRRAYADRPAQVGDPDFDHESRCLSFLTSGWASPRDACALVGLIGEYNGFDPAEVKARLRSIARKPGDSRVAVGREGSPVLYVETDNRQAVVDALPPSADELRASPDHFVGMARMHVNDDSWPYDPHIFCEHDDPPVPVNDYAEPAESRVVVRAWWD